jgi:hypothetical protein
MFKFKFKVGDKVKTSWFASIKSNTADDRWAVMTGWMEKLVGKEGIILTTEDYYGIPRYELSNGWMWPESALTLVEAKNQFNPGDKVNVSMLGIEWTDIDELYYVGMNRKGEYVIENKNGGVTPWEYCRPFKEKITYNVWKHKDADMLCTLKENALQPIGEWKIIHTFTI